jgi:hypothetical protein
MDQQAHTWRFFRSGGFDQIRLETAEDIRELAGLDPKLWAALSCPTHHLEFDRQTLAFLDTDADGHVRVGEIIAATRWVSQVLKDPGSIMEGAASLPLDAIDETDAEGAILLASAQQILKVLDRPQARRIGLEDIASLSSIIASTRFNGDGIVPPSAATESDLEAAIASIMAVAGSEQDRCGQPGLSEAGLTSFFDQARAYDAWWQEAEQNQADILLLGTDTAAARQAFDAVKATIDDYFTRCQLADYDLRAAEPLNPALSAYEALAGARLSQGSEALIDLPLARIQAGQPLPLVSGINPAWRQAMAEFKARVVAPLLGAAESLSAEAWDGLCQRFALHQVWLAKKPGAGLDTMGLERVRELLKGGYQDRIAALIGQDKALAAHFDAIGSVEKLIRYHGHLFDLLNNFVSFRDFYTRRKPAIFQAGTLYLDGRSCDFCLSIGDVEQHSGMANLSGTYLAYCECRRKGTESQMQYIVAAFTNGDADNLMVGRNGIFYDRKGQDWDATIIKIIEHPISVRQAFWYPFKRIGKMIGEQMEKFASAGEKSVLDKAAQSLDAPPKAEPGKAAAPFDVGKFAGIFAAMGLAIGAIGTAIASVVTGFMSLPIWQMPLLVVGLILIISGPSMLLAWLKLRKRNLAPLLDANGWAVNTRAIINIPFGASLTKVATLPPGAQRALTDPYAEKKTPWKTWLVILALVTGLFALWYFDFLSMASSLSDLDR